MLVRIGAGSVQGRGVFIGRVRLGDVYDEGRRVVVKVAVRGADAVDRFAQRGCIVALMWFVEGFRFFCGSFYFEVCWYLRGYE